MITGGVLGIFLERRRFLPFSLAKSPQGLGPQLPNWRILLGEYLCEMMHIDAYCMLLRGRDGFWLNLNEVDMLLSCFLISESSFGTKIHPIGIFGQGNCRKLVKPMKVIGGDRPGGFG